MLIIYWKRLAVINDKIFYLNNAGEVSYGWQNIEGKSYYFGNDGFALNGFQELDGKIYFFSNIIIP